MTTKLKRTTKKSQIETAERIDLFTMKIDVSTPKFPDTYLICDYEDFVRWRDTPEYGRICPFQPKFNTYPYACFQNNEKGSRKTIKFHRFVTDNVFKCVDHINRNGLDNRKENLRDGSNGINQQNTKQRTDNTSGFIGVSFYKHSGKYQAQIKLNGKQKHLGYFDTSEEASEAYQEAKKSYHKI